jgi:hypothetical protein
LTILLARPDLIWEIDFLFWETDFLGNIIAKGKILLTAGAVELLSKALAKKRWNGRIGKHFRRLS